MKISLDINIVVAFIKDLSDNPMVKTLNGCMFLSAVADGIQEVDAAPNTRSNKRKQDPYKEGDSMYVASEESSTPSKCKKAKMDCRNAMEKDPVAVPRRINLANMPMPSGGRILRSLGPVAASFQQPDKGNPKQTDGKINKASNDMIIIHQISLTKLLQKGEASATEDGMKILKEWAWPIMGHKPTWATNGKPPAPTLLASRCLATLSTIKHEENRRKLTQLVEDLDEMENGDNIRHYSIEVNSLVGVNMVLDVRLCLTRDLINVRRNRADSRSVNHSY
ncbi:hypothetical protein EV421DRAFT_1951250 [Armillaria borealis]|uniref:Uncharacterized protein n=1 Tax=Armillaria borealis TaxID=47425 RepID=A0AA39MP97_9AGAR|nr:hypothetical protein EV421DRAFT_1951250 [Armillaria borealis]